eukprot:360955-Chlamydomonas_euryale.AAC.4
MLRLTGLVSATSSLLYRFAFLGCKGGALGENSLRRNSDGDVSAVGQIDCAVQWRGNARAGDEAARRRGRVLCGPECVHTTQLRRGLSRKKATWRTSPTLPTHAPCGLDMPSGPPETWWTMQLGIWNGIRRGNAESAVVCRECGLPASCAACREMAVLCVVPCVGTMGRNPTPTRHNPRVAPRHVHEAHVWRVGQGHLAVSERERAAPTHSRAWAAAGFSSMFHELSCWATCCCASCGPSFHGIPMT